MLASSQGHDEIVRQLLEAKANAGLRKNKSDTALLAAMRGDFQGCILPLLMQGSLESLNAADAKGQTALHLSVANMEILYVQQLLARGVAVNAVDNDAATPFALAVKSGHMDTIHMLLEASEQKKS